MVDVTRQNLSLLAGAGDMISTTEDLQAFFSALLSKTLTASITTGDAAMDPAQEYLKALDKLVKAVFCDGQIVVG